MGKKEDLAKQPSQVRTRFQHKAQNCGICYNSIQEQGVLDNCTHEFCFECIAKWAEKENTCPVCKRRFTTLNKKQNRINYSEKNLKISKKKDHPKEFTVPQRNQCSQFNEVEQIQLINNFIRTIHLYYSENNPLLANRQQRFGFEIRMDEVNRGTQHELIFPLPINLNQNQNNNQQDQSVQVSDVFEAINNNNSL